MGLVQMEVATVWGVMTLKDPWQTDWFYRKSQHQLQKKLAHGNFWNLLWDDCKLWVKIPWLIACLDSSALAFNSRAHVTKQLGNKWQHQVRSTLHCGSISLDLHSHSNLRVVLWIYFIFSWAVTITSITQQVHCQLHDAAAHCRAHSRSKETAVDIVQYCWVVLRSVTGAESAGL